MVRGKQRLVLLACEEKPQRVRDLWPRVKGQMPRTTMTGSLRALEMKRLLKKSGLDGSYGYSLTAEGVREKERCKDLPPPKETTSRRAFKFKSKAIEKAMRALEDEKQDHLDAVKAIEAAMDALEI
jgi:DNA-binding PadR family transcriptional regulator